MHRPACNEDGRKVGTFRSYDTVQGALDVFLDNISWCPCIDGSLDAEKKVCPI